KCPRLSVRDELASLPPSTHPGGLGFGPNNQSSLSSKPPPTSHKERDAPYSLHRWTVIPPGPVNTYRVSPHRWSSCPDSANEGSGASNVIKLPPSKKPLDVHPNVTPPRFGKKTRPAVSKNRQPSSPSATLQPAKYMRQKKGNRTLYFCKSGSTLTSI